MTDKICLPFMPKSRSVFPLFLPGKDLSGNRNINGFIMLLYNIATWDK